MIEQGDGRLGVLQRAGRCMNCSTSVDFKQSIEKDNGEIVNEYECPVCSLVSVEFTSIGVNDGNDE